MDVNGLNYDSGYTLFYLLNLIFPNYIRIFSTKYLIANLILDFEFDCVLTILITLAEKEDAEEVVTDETLKTSDDNAEKSKEEPSTGEVADVTDPEVPEEEVTDPKEPEEVTDENLDEALNAEAEIEANAEGVDEPLKDIPAAEKFTVLSQYMARRLVQSISKGLLPQLHKSIATKTRHEGSHKANKKRVSSDLEEEELMRVPIALAMVKLLQKLPHGMLDSNLRG